MTLKEHPVNKLKNTFISGYYMKDLSICDELIDYYEKTDDKKPGLVVGGVVDKSVKDSTEIPIYLWEDKPNTMPDIFRKYANALQEMLEFYKLQYPILDEAETWCINTPCNMQKYNPGGGFKSVHFERGSFKHHTRFLVFMTYLNDVKDGGGTKWVFQDIELKAEKGLTVFWPTDWTHTHVGIVSPTETKYILTGWYSFLKEV